MNELLRALLGLLIVTALVLYGRGWWRMRRLGSPVASIYRLIVFCVASLLVGVAFLSPLHPYSSQLLFFRSLQTVILVLLAAPAYFLSCGYDVMLWGLPAAWRRQLKGNLHRNAPLGRTVRRLTPIGLIWVLFLVLFVVWHEPTWVNWSMGRPWVHTAGLIVLGLLALLFWWHVVGTGPRLHPSLAPWLIAIMLVITEIINMLTGVSTAFSGVAFYDHYVSVHRAIARKISAPWTTRPLPARSCGLVAVSSMCPASSWC
ncbi:MAG: cytochrome c oxidase assembly protein [Anaerolineales bacterium]|nr:cytochrome c oxidase assembly protein [Anaerolineales bacterium]